MWRAIRGRSARGCEALLRLGRGAGYPDQEDFEMPDVREPRYLGDGLYASFDGYQIRLYADRGPEGVSEVFLELGTLNGFDQYRAELRAQGWG